MTCWCKGACPIIRNFRQLESQGRERDAEMALKTALIDTPGCVEANLALARIYSESNRACFAPENLARAATTMGKSWVGEGALALARARVARSETKIPEAVRLFLDACAVDPKNPEARADAIMAMIAAGEPTDQALVFSSQAQKDFPNDLDVRRAVAALVAAFNNFEGARDDITAGGNMRPLDYLDRGRYRDKLGDVDGAWADWTEGKNQLREKRNFLFQRDAFDNTILQLVTFATKKRLRQVPKIWPAPRDDGPQPIFVLGFPRSGTTMTETAISAHSAIVAGDELPFVSEIIKIMPGMFGIETPYPFAMIAAGLSENVTGLGLLRDWYLRRAMFRLAPDGWPKGTKFFTDKMCLNEIHIPLLLRLFPDSPIFICRRHPLDVALSNWSYYIRHGWQYGASLQAMAHVMVTVDALVERYRELFPGKIHIVKYEDFVSDHQAAIERIFLEGRLPPPEPACFDFHENPRFSRTISHRQVKEPVHDRSAGRWYAYREKFPQQLLDAVRPICERDGYDC